MSRLGGFWEEVFSSIFSFVICMGFFSGVLAMMWWISGIGPVESAARFGAGVGFAIAALGNANYYIDRIKP